MSEDCHLKDCGREAVIGTMEVWGPEYKVAMCEHHVMERIRRIADLERQLAEAQGKLDLVEQAANECGVACYVHTVLRPEVCSCGGPSTHPCGPDCKYPYTDSKEGNE